MDGASPVILRCKAMTTRSNITRMATQSCQRVWIEGRANSLPNRIFQSGDRIFQWGPLILLDFICRGCGNCHRANLGEQLEFSSMLKMTLSSHAKEIPRCSRSLATS